MLCLPPRGAAPGLVLGHLFVVEPQLVVQFLFDPGPGLTHVRSGKLRLLAVGSPKRSPQFPNTPTLAESGMPGFDADTYFGFYAPAAVSQEIVVRLNREINRLLGTPQVRERIEALGGEPTPITPAQFGEMSRVDRERFGVVIRAAGIKAD